MNKIIYIDEDNKELSKLKRLIDRNAKDLFILETQKPIKNINKLIDNILKNNYDAVISDENLSANMSKITYSGHDIVNQLKKKCKDLPCFILTSYPDIVDGKINDSNYIYEKTFVYETNTDKIPTLTFLKKLSSTANSYRTKLSAITKKLSELQKKETLTIDEKKVVLECNEFLSSNMGIGTDNILTKLLDLNIDTLLYDMRNLLEKIKTEKDEKK